MTVPVASLPAQQHHSHKASTPPRRSGRAARGRRFHLPQSLSLPPLPFLYEATGVLTRFTDQRDPKRRSREVSSFHRPETLREFLSQDKSLRARLHDLPTLDPAGLRDCQISAITELEKSFKMAKPRGLATDVSNVGRWGNGDVEVMLQALDDVPYVTGLARQALECQLGDESDSE